MSRSTTPQPATSISSARSTPTQVERRRSVVCFNDQCAIIPEVENIKPHLGKRTYSIPLARKPSPDLYYDPTFTPDPRKCFKISLPHLSRAPPIRKPGRRLSTGGTSLFGYRGKDADGACGQPGEGLKGCLVIKENGDGDGVGEEEDEFDEGELRLAQKRKVKQRRLSLQSLDRMEGRGGGGGGAEWNDPMSVLRVLKGCGNAQAEGSDAGSSVNGNAPPTAYKPVTPSAAQRITGNDATPSPTTSTGSGHKWSSRPNILTRRTNSTDKVPSSPSSSFSMGASLRRWTSDSDNNNNNGLAQGSQPAGKPECILEDQPLILPSSPTSTRPPPSPFSSTTNNTKPSRTPSSASTATATSLTAPSDEIPAFIPLRACCKACCRATDRGLEETWEPPMSKRAKRQWEVGKMTESLHGGVNGAGSGSGSGTLHHHSGGGAGGEDEDDEKPLNVVVDEVDYLRRRRSSGESGCGLREQKDAETEKSASPSGGIWLCSGRSGGSRSGSAASSPKGSIELSPNHGVIGPGKYRTSAPSSPLNEMGAFPKYGHGHGNVNGSGVAKVSPTMGLVDWETALESVEAERAAGEVGGRGDYFSAVPIPHAEENQMPGGNLGLAIGTPQQEFPLPPSKSIPLIETNGKAYHLQEKSKAPPPPRIALPDDIAAQLKAEVEAAKKMPKTPPATSDSRQPQSLAAKKEGGLVRNGSSGGNGSGSGRNGPERKKSQGWLKGILGGGQARGVLAV